MIGPKVSAEGGSIAIGGDVKAPILNVHAATVNVTVEQQIARELPSFSWFCDRCLLPAEPGKVCSWPPKIVTP